MMLAALALSLVCSQPQPLTVFCAAGVRAPVEAVAASWTKATGQPVHLQFGGSGTLLNNLRVAPRADLYLAAADGYMAQARKHGVVAESVPLAHQQLVIAVPEGNPAGITSLANLVEGGHRVAMPNPDAAAAGRTCRAVLQQAGLWDSLQPAVVVTKPTVNEVAADVKLGIVDAAITWDTTTNLLPGLEAVQDPVFAPSRERVSIGVVRASRQPTQALRFARWIGSRDKGAPHFKQAGFAPVQGDTWAERPRLTLFAGGMLRPALEPVVEAFCQREGVHIDRTYNGCGVLVAQMRNGATPDAYAACDQAFFDMVAGDFGTPIRLSRNSMVILVPADNPANIRGVADLLTPGVRMGVASPERSALGALTVNALTNSGHWEALQRSGNIKVESATGDFLVNQVRAGGLDAAIVYHSNARASAPVREQTVIVPLDIDAPPAAQPWSVRRDCDHAHTLGRLLNAIEAARKRGAFEALGFMPPEPPAT